MRMKQVHIHQFEIAHHRKDSSYLLLFVLDPWYPADPTGSLNSVRVSLFARFGPHCKINLGAALCHLRFFLGATIRRIDSP